MQLDKSSARVRQMFGEIAGRYDLLNHVLSLGHRSGLAAENRSPRAAQAGRRADPRCLHRHRRPGPGLLEGQRPQGPHRGHRFLPSHARAGQSEGPPGGAEKQISWLEADTQQLPFPDDLFQIVCVAFGLRNVSDTDRGLREMARVCRPGGSVAVLEFSMPTLWPLGPLYGWYFHRVLPRIGQALARNHQSAYNYLPASVSQFPQGEELAARMRAAGLARVEHYRFTPGDRHALRGHK